ncbi:MAG: zinc ribbon domain-containing protein [Deltaproteobacteria bacterium]|nr:zinc ribbon domain-containing protein [Deltaproteobacteria bacterium]
MPIYEYECKDCGEIFEALVYLSSNTELVCPKCGSKSVSKKISKIAARSNCGSCSSCSSSSGGFT